jgi:GrpB-like predicted nucleotidyltransferase (UPF0157 family)
VRELEEELGLCVEVEEFIMTTRLTDITPSRDFPIDMMAYCYLIKGMARSGVKIEEDHEIEWMPLEEACYRLKLPHQGWVIEALLAKQPKKIISTYNGLWQWWFMTIKGKLREVLPKEMSRIEHIGSTAITGMLAKAVIDIDVVVPLGIDFDVICQYLGRLGYEHIGNQGIEGREAFNRQKNAVDETLNALPHHLYVCYEDSPELKRHLLLRDRLRADTSLRDAYNNIKKVIVSTGGVVTIYKMMIYSWGGTFYFRDGVAITKAEFHQGTSY